MLEFLGKFLEKFARNKNAAQPAAICYWCDGGIYYGDSITYHGLFKPKPVDSFPKGVMAFTEGTAVKVVGCCHKDCPGNRNGILIAGTLEKTGIVFEQDAKEKTRFLGYL